MEARRRQSMWKRSERKEMHVVRWLCGLSLSERRTSDEFAKVDGNRTCAVKRFNERCELSCKAMFCET